jgi:hypothetical protein
VAAMPDVGWQSALPAGFRDESFAPVVMGVIGNGLRHLNSGSPALIFLIPT